MSPEAEKFLSKLRARAGKGVRVLPEQYRSAIADAFPMLGAQDSRARLAAFFEELERAGQISLPRSHHLYDRVGAAKLPAWISIVRDLPPRQAVGVDPKTFPWAPELRFACDLSDRRQIDCLLRVQDFLSSGGRTRPMVPAKERSVELFGEEKRLDRLKNGPLFGSGRMSLDLLRCYTVLPPLVFQALPTEQTARPILVLENYSTYHSFTRWNQQTKTFEATVYGHGETFDTAAVGVVEITRSMNWDGRVFYFGDVDMKGVLIAVAASETLRAAHGATIEPHLGCYRRLLRRATEVQLPASVSVSLPDQCCLWLGDDIGHEADTWLKRGIRLPQELVGWEELSRAGETFAYPPSDGRAVAA